MFKNPLFCGILFTTMALQVLIVQFGSVAFHVAEGGLEGKFWAISLGLGVGSLPWQQVINVCYFLGVRYKGYRMKKRLQRNASLSRRHADGELALLTTDSGGH
jgi:Ca2+ transporting ATPase